MENHEPQTLAKKTWAGAWKAAQAEWSEAWEFDRRGIFLSTLLLLACACTLALSLAQLEPEATSKEVLGFVVFLFGFLGNFFLALILKHRFSEEIASAVASAFVFAFLVFAFVVAGAAPLAGAGVIFIALASVIAVARVVAVASVVGVASVVAFTSFFAVAGVGANAFAGIFAIAVVVAATRLLQENSVRGFSLFKRVQKFHHKGSHDKKARSEATALRQACGALLRNLQAQQRALTIGLAGRRGLGKTALLREALQEHAVLPTSQIERDNDLKNRQKVKAARIQRFTLFVPTPTEFAEQTFLMALLERVAQSFNETLIRLLPVVKHFVVEQELREKRRVLRRSHAIQLALLFLAFGCNWYFLNQTNRAPAWRNPFAPADSLTATTFAPPKLYTEMRDSLLAELRAQAAPLHDSLVVLQKLVSPRIADDSWNKKGFWSGVLNDFFIQATWDSLKRSTMWPKLDSLQQTHLRYQAVLDSIQAISLRYQTLADSVTLLSKDAFRANASPLAYSFWFWFNCVLLLLIFPAYYFSREGEQRFTKRVYSVVRNEIALYERTNALLERLHFQMSFGESKESGASFSQSGWQFGRKFSKQVQRQTRPYTTMSLIDEYRNYIEEAKLYLNDALKQSDPETQERLKIVIAIDELDKILDTDKLHNMLKSMKPIFEIEDVCYLLSISEDALETYRLRHVDTKNEIDSVFTHIIPLPPMDALGSLAFYCENYRSANLPNSDIPLNPPSKGELPRAQHDSPLEGGQGGVGHVDEKSNEVNANSDIPLNPPSKGDLPHNTHGWPPKLLPAAIVFGGGVPRDMHRLAQVFGTYPREISLQECLQRLAQEDRSACEDMLLLHSHLSDEGKQFWLKIVERTGFTSQEETEKLLGKIEGHSLEDFMKLNPCSGDKAKEEYHRLRSLVRGIVVKSLVYFRVAQLETPELLAAWPAQAEIDALLARAKEDEPLKHWLVQLEPLRDAIFELSRNPLRVWERLKEEKRVS